MSAVPSAVVPDFASLSDHSLEAFIRTNRDQIHQLESLEAGALAVWNNRKRWTYDGSRSAGSRLGRETGIGEKRGRHLVRRADRLSRMAGTSAAFGSGQLSSERVDLLTSAFEPELEAVFKRDEADLLAEISQRSFANAKAVIANWKQRARSETGTTRDRRAKRGVEISNSAEDFVRIEALFDPIDGEIIASELERLEGELFTLDWSDASRKKHEVPENGDLANPDLANPDLTNPDLTNPDLTNPEAKPTLRRTRRHRLADAMVEMAKRSATRSKSGTPPRTVIHILAGERRFENLLETFCGRPLSDEELLPHLSQAQIHHIMYAGKAVKTITHKRFFTGALREAILFRDRHCQDPSGCETPAHRCDADHCKPFSRGGKTTAENGQCLCAFHNQLKGSRDLTGDEVTENEVAENGDLV